MNEGVSFFFFHLLRNGVQLQHDQEQSRVTTQHTNTSIERERKMGTKTKRSEQIRRPPTVISTTFCIFFHYLATHFNQLQICVGASAS